MKGYLSQLWNDPAFFANTMKSLLVTAGVGGATYLTNPIGRNITEKLIIAGIAAVSGGVASLPSKKVD